MTADNQFVTAHYLRQAAERLRTLKTLSYDRMGIAPGATVLDVGCGPGIDAAALAGRVGVEGRVIAVDADPAMLVEGERHAQAQGLTERILFQLGSALALPLADGAVAASRAERLIQVLPPGDEARVVAEMRRVTRPGGRIVLVDTDWGTGSVDCTDDALERKLMTFFAQRMRPNGFAGRRLFRLVREHGLHDITVEAESVLQHHLDATPMEWLADTALSAAIITASEHRRWLDDLRAREDAGTLFMQTTMVIVSGEVTSN